MIYFIFYKKSESCNGNNSNNCVICNESNHRELNDFHECACKIGFYDI